MRRRAGFTLIELLIVMAIIAALMAVLVPTATGAMRKARATRIAVQLRNFEQGVEQYILATLPDSDDVGNLTDASVTNAGFAEDIDTSTKNLEATAGTDKITITVTATVTDSTLAQLVKGTLGETFSGGSQGTITVNNNVITITKDIEAFWW
ncbi:type II secretion system protein [Thermotoga petrophila]|uniref:type II secretion system protein n=1 Tax=Thermotoga petrophila TaxID=93929 RepID=UPI002FE2FBB7